MTTDAVQKAELFSEVLTLLGKRGGQVNGTDWLRAVKATLENESPTDAVVVPPAYNVADLFMPGEQLHTLTFGAFADKAELRAAIESSGSIQLDNLTTVMLGGIFGSPFKLVADQMAATLKILSADELGMDSPLKYGHVLSRCIRAGTRTCPAETALLLALHPPKLRVGDKVHVLSEKLNYSTAMGPDTCILTLERTGKDTYAIRLTDVDENCMLMPDTFFAALSSD